MNTNEQITSLMLDLMGLSQKWARRAGFSMKPEDQCLLGCALELAATLSDYKDVLLATPGPAVAMPELRKEQSTALETAYAERLAEIMQGLMQSSGEVHLEWLKEWERLNLRFAGVYAAIEHQKKTPSPLSGPQ